MSDDVDMLRHDMEMQIRDLETNASHRIFALEQQVADLRELVLLQQDRINDLKLGLSSQKLGMGTLEALLQQHMGLAEQRAQAMLLLTRLVGEVCNWASQHDPQGWSCPKSN